MSKNKRLMDAEMVEIGTQTAIFKCPDCGHEFPVEIPFMKRHTIVINARTIKRNKPRRKLNLHR